MEQEKTHFHIEHSKSKTRSSMTVPHFHEYYEMYMFLGDDMNYFVDNRTYRLRKHDIVFIGKSTYHRTFYHDSCSRERILVVFDDRVISPLLESNAAELISNLFATRKLQTEDENVKNTFRGLLEAMETAYSENSVTGMLKAKHLFFYLLLEAAHLNAGELPCTSDESSPGDIIRKAADYINTHYSEKISLEQVASLCYVSKYYLCHLFKKTTGMTMNNYLKEKRLVEAEKLLRYSHESIASVSSLTGFPDTNNFITNFKTRHGRTPSRYRSSFLKI